MTPDLLGKLPGRGIWVTAEREPLETAVRKNLFSRAAKEQVTVPEGLVADVEAGCVRRTVELLSMARKAGQAVAGFEKVKEWLAKEEAAILLQASDGSERGKSKLRPPGGKGSFFGCPDGVGNRFGIRSGTCDTCGARRGDSLTVREDAIRLSGVREDGGGAATGKVKKSDI